MIDDTEASPAFDAPAVPAPPNASLALDFARLTFTYPGADEPVLCGLDWRVPEGAFALLVGGTGSGKSTLLSLAKPEIAPTGTRTGSIRVFGESVEALSPAASAHTVGYVFQNPENQIVCESVWHELAFGLENLGTPQGEMRRRIAETSYFFGIDDWFRHDTATLSGGRRQLLALASTLVMRPRVLLLDEPTAQLDPIAEKNFLHALFRVNRELGCTVVVATHQPRAMVDYATCAFQLVDGHVEKLADLDALRARPALLGEEGPHRPGDASCATKSCRFSERNSMQAEYVPRKPRAGRENHQVNELPNQRDFASTRDGSDFVLKTDTIPRATIALAPALALERAWFRYERDSDWVLRGLDLVVPHGGIHALVGDNGCGKSTLLALMAGVRKLQRGKLRRDVRSSALLPQDPRALFVADTVAEELMEWSRAAGYSRADADAMLARVGLAGTERRHPYDLSGGQQQLLALAKLVLIDPELLLLDEPTKGLDLASRRLVARLLRELAVEGRTVVMATHDLDAVEQLADEVSMVFDGEVACTEPSKEFFEGNVYYRP